MIGRRFLDTNKQLRRVVWQLIWRDVAPLGLGRAQISLILALGKDGMSTQSALARACSIDPSQATRALAQLAQRGWIRRRRGEEDRRESHVELTAAGRRVFERAELATDATAKLLSAVVDERDVADLARIYTKVAPLVEESVPEPRRVPELRRRRQQAKR